MSITSEGMGLTNTIQGIEPIRINDRGTGNRNSGAAGDGVFSSVLKTALKTVQGSYGTDRNDGDDNFLTSIFKDAIQNVRDTDAEFVDAQYLLATGQLDNPAQLSLAAYKNEIAVDLLIQLRNRALEMYNQLTSMNV